MRKGTILRSLLAAVVLLALVPAQAQDIRPDIAAALSKGDTTRAEALLKEQIGLDKAYHLNYYLLGMIYYNRGLYDRATEQFRLALDRKSSHFESWNQLGLAYLDLGDVENARAAFTDGGKKAPKESKHIFDNGLGLVAMAEKKYQDASTLFQQASVKDTANAEYMINLGDAYFYQGVAPLAVTYYEKALNIDTGGTEVYFHWAEACLEIKDYNCAMDKLRTVLRRDSTHAQAWRRAGQIYFKAGQSSRTRDERTERFKETIGSYRRFIELSGAKPDSANVRPFFELAMAYLNLNAFDSAYANFERVLAIPYEPRDIYYYEGRAYWGYKDYVHAGEFLEKHLDWVARQGDAYTSSISPADLYQLLGDAWFYREHATDADKSADYVKSIDYYKRSLEADPNQARLLYNVAVAYHSLGDFSQAIKYYDLRIAQGIDTAQAGTLKNAAYCALNLADEASKAETGGAPLAATDSANPGGEVAQPIDAKQQYQLGVDYMLRYLGYVPADTAILKRVGYTYLYNLSDCANGVQYYQKVLQLDPKNCEALKSIGFAYFGGLCNKDYSKAIDYLTRANACYNGASPCGDPTTMLWLAQAHHLRAADKEAAKQDAKPDYQQANAYYGKVLKCEPGNAEAKKGQNDTQYLF